MGFLLNILLDTDCSNYIVATRWKQVQILAFFAILTTYFVPNINCTIIPSISYDFFYNLGKFQRDLLLLSLNFLLSQRRLFRFTALISNTSIFALKLIHLMTWCINLHIVCRRSEAAQGSSGARSKQPI
jgi:hypothetical protein